MKETKNPDHDKKYRTTLAGILKQQLPFILLLDDEERCSCFDERLLLALRLNFPVNSGGAPFLRVGGKSNECFPIERNDCKMHLK